MKVVTNYPGPEHPESAPLVPGWMRREAASPLPCPTAAWVREMETTVRTKEASPGTPTAGVSKLLWPLDPAASPLGPAGVLVSKPVTELVAVPGSSTP